MTHETGKGVDTGISPITERIAALPEDKAHRLRELESMLVEEEGYVRAVKDEIIAIRNEIERNINPDDKTLVEISDRFALSRMFGVSRKDFDIAINKIGTNERAFTQLRCLKSIGAEMTIISVNESEVLFIDTVDNINVKAQKEFIFGLDSKEYFDAVSTLEQRFPGIEQLLKRGYGKNGLNYYEYLLICEIAGAEPMPEVVYKALQDRKPVDLCTVCWLLTDQEKLDRFDAVRGYRTGCGIGLVEDADWRFPNRAGRPMLRVKIA